MHESGQGSNPHAAIAHPRSFSLHTITTTHVLCHQNALGEEKPPGVNKTPGGDG